MTKSSGARHFDRIDSFHLDLKKLYRPKPRLTSLG